MKVVLPVDPYVLWAADFLLADIGLASTSCCEHANLRPHADAAFHDYLQYGITQQLSAPTAFAISVSWRQMDMLSRGALVALSPVFRRMNVKDRMRSATEAAGDRLP